ncbi:hypothetical protein JTB14_012637 [Gonioctena quinquepunctata]|nr:hypothetical protein JTB14_012637 [Gonioctena quinquepunctata]
MDKREEEKLLRWFEELSDDDNIESEHDPFSDDGKFSGDSDYAPDESPLSETSNEEDNDELIFQQDSSNEETEDNNLQKNQTRIYKF